MNRLMVLFFAAMLISAPANAEEFEWPWAKKEKKVTSNTAVLEERTLNEIDETSQETPVVFKKIPAKPVVFKKPVGKPTFKSPHVQIQNIQNELIELTKQTQSINAKSQADRQKLLKIMQQVRIQQKLLKSIKKPPTTTKIPIVSREDILRNTKARLIAAEVTKTRQQLNLINQVAKTPAPIRTIPTRKVTT